MVVVRELTLVLGWVPGAEVRRELVGRDDRLRLEDGGGRRDGHHRSQRPQEDVHLGQVLAVGALALPQERHGVEAQHVDTEVGEAEHDGQHLEQDVGVRPVEVPLVVVEGGPHPLFGVGQPREVARRERREDLPQRALVAIRHRAIGEEPVVLPVVLVAGTGGQCPGVLGGSVVDDEIDAQVRVTSVQRRRERAEIVHRPEAGFDLVEGHDGVATVVLAAA